MVNGLNMSLQIRRTPYTARVEAAGVRGFTVVNHMLLSLTVHRVERLDLLDHLDRAPGG